MSKIRHFGITVSCSWFADVILCSLVCSAEPNLFLLVIDIHLFFFNWIFYHHLAEPNCLRKCGKLSLFRDLLPPFPPNTTNGGASTPPIGDRCHPPHQRGRLLLSPFSLPTLPQGVFSPPSLPQSPHQKPPPSNSPSQLAPHPPPFPTPPHKSPLLPPPPHTHPTKAQLPAILGSSHFLLKAAIVSAWFVSSVWSLLHSSKVSRFGWQGMDTSGSSQRVIAGHPWAEAHLSVATEVQGHRQPPVQGRRDVHPGPWRSSTGPLSPDRWRNNPDEQIAAATGRIGKLRQAIEALGEGDPAVPALKEQLKKAQVKA